MKRSPLISRDGETYTIGYRLGKPDPLPPSEGSRVVIDVRLARIWLLTGGNTVWERVSGKSIRGIEIKREAMRREWGLIITEAWVIHDEFNILIDDIYAQLAREAGGR